MLRQLRLQNLRCYKDHSFTFEHHSVVVGRNNAGKSTLVEALLILATVLGKRGRTFKPAPSWLGLSRFRRCVAPSLEFLNLNLRTVFHRYSDPPATITATFTGGTVVTVYIGREERVYATVEGSRGWAETPLQLQQLDIPPVHALAQLGPLRMEEPLLEPEYVREWMFSRLSSLHFRNQLKLMPVHFRDFKDLAERTWRGLRVDPVAEDAGKSGSTLSLMVRDVDFTAEVGWMGSGVQMWLQTMWFLARAPALATVILDEPDVYLHPDLQRKLFRLIKSKFNQTIITTHSVEIMAEAQPSEILIIDKRKRRSVYANSEPAVQHLVDHIGGVHNIHLARLWNARRFILVEGKDLGVLRHFHMLINPESETPFDSIPNLSIGGWGGWTYAIGSTMVIQNSVGERVAVYCILDRDYHTTEEIEERMREAEEKGISLHIWSRKELENYFLNPTAIRRVIASRIADKALAPSVQTVTDKMSSLADDLKDPVIDGFAERYHAMDKRLGMGAIRKAREWVANQWSDSSKQLSLVPGKEMLSRLSEWTRKEYGVSFGVASVWRAFKLQEIPEEVTSVVRAIDEGVPFP